MQTVLSVRPTLISLDHQVRKYTVTGQLTVNHVAQISR